MNTVFTFKATKATENGGIQYRVDLGQDILEGMSEDTVESYAVAHAKVEIQNRKGSILRQSGSIEDAVATLKSFGFGDVSVEVYTPTTKPKVLTIADIRKAISSGKINKAEVEEYIKTLNA